MNFKYDEEQKFVTVLSTNPVSNGVLVRPPRGSLRRRIYWYFDTFSDKTAIIWLEAQLECRLGGVVVGVAPLSSVCGAPNGTVNGNRAKASVTGGSNVIVQNSVLLNMNFVFDSGLSSVALQPWEIVADLDLISVVNIKMSDPQNKLVGYTMYLACSSFK